MPDEEPLRVLFVCTANISRSPYAERRAIQLADGDNTITFASAGIPGAPRQGMDPGMSAELTLRGGMSWGHVSRALTPGLLESSDVVVTAEFAHRLRIVDRWPSQATKIFGLRQLADAMSRVNGGTPGGLTALDHALRVAPADGLSWDVADPYRRGRAAAAACADEIDRCLRIILPALSTADVEHG